LCLNENNNKIINIDDDNVRVLGDVPGIMDWLHHFEHIEQPELYDDDVVMTSSDSSGSECTCIFRVSVCVSVCVCACVCMR